MTRPQEYFWKNEITESYAQDNATFDEELGLLAWQKMLNSIELKEIRSYLDCGSNVGRNISFLKRLMPEAQANIIELAEGPFNKCKNDFDIKNSFLGPIKNARFNQKFELVFTSGVLIHINPDDLLITMKSIYENSSKYILIAEYFNRTPVEIDYRGQSNMLFKRDFGKFFKENFECEVVDYGFLWGDEFDSAGFDDITYWLFEKSEQ